MTSSLAAALAASKANADSNNNNMKNDDECNKRGSKVAPSSLMQHAKKQHPQPNSTQGEMIEKQQATITSPAKQSLAVASASAAVVKQGTHHSHDIKPTPSKNDKYNSKHCPNKTPTSAKYNANKDPNTPKSHRVNIKNNKSKNKHSAKKEEYHGIDNNKKNNNENVQALVFVCDIPSSDEEEVEEEEEGEGEGEGEGKKYKHIDDNVEQHHNNPLQNKNVKREKGKTTHQQQQQQQQELKQQGGKVVNVNASRRMIGHALGTRFHDKDIPDNGGNRHQSKNLMESPSNPGAMPTPWSKKAQELDHGTIPRGRSDPRDRNNRNDTNNYDVGKDTAGTSGRSGKNDYNTRNTPRDKTHQKANNSHRDHDHRVNDRTSSRNDGRVVDGGGFHRGNESSTHDDDDHRQLHGKNADSREFNRDNCKIGSNASSVTAKPVSVEENSPKLESAILKGRWADEDSSSDEE
ncbi:hypothetical protein ACHAXS_003732 [Conticribra weissflogii]